MKRTLALFLFAAVMLAACTQPTPNDTAAQAMEMRVYQVPPEQTDTVVQALSSVFVTSEGGGRGKVSSAAPGQIVVLAPANLQGSIEASVRALGTPQAPKPQGHPEQQIRFSMWSVDAIPENGPDDLELATVTNALEEVRKQLGGVRFVLRDQVSAVSSPGKQVKRSWVGTKLTSDSASPVQQLAYELQPVGDELMLNLTIGDQVPVIQGDAVQYINVGATTTTAIHLGQTLVVTQTPIPRNAMSSGEVSLSDRATRLYLVRADAVPAN